MFHYFSSHLANLYSQIFSGSSFFIHLHLNLIFQERKLRQGLKCYFYLSGTSPVRKSWVVFSCFFLFVCLFFKAHKQWRQRAVGALTWQVRLFGKPDRRNCPQSSIQERRRKRIWSPWLLTLPVFYWSKSQRHGLPWIDWWHHPNSSLPQFSPSFHSSLVLQWVFFLNENHGMAMPQDKTLLLLWISSISTDNPVIQFKAFPDIYILLQPSFLRIEKPYWLRSLEQGPANLAYCLFLGILWTKKWFLHF